MTTAIHKMVEQARSGGNPRVIAKLSSGWAVLGDKQVLPGYSLLLPDPVVPHLNAMSLEARKQFLFDMSMLGEAILNVTGATRINYEMLGNLEPALHAHVIPRYPEKESETLRTKPIWFYEWDRAPLFDLERDYDLLRLLAAELKKLNASP
jgi:diadenosine tetraphosphate (Ap4A) HIT family hydrolase